VRIFLKKKENKKIKEKKSDLKLVANKNKKMFLFVYLFGHQVTKKIIKILKK